MYTAISTMISSNLHTDSLFIQKRAEDFLKSTRDLIMQSKLSGKCLDATMVGAKENNADMPIKPL